MGNCKMQLEKRTTASEKKCLEKFNLERPIIGAEHISIRICE